LCLAGGRLYAGGNFQLVGGQPLQCFAALDTATAVVLSPDLKVDGAVATIVTRGGRIYAGGTFTSVLGTARIRLAAVDSATFALTSWAPGANGEVDAMAATDSVIYIGGSFTTCGGQSRRAIAAIDRITGAASPWNPNPSVSASVLALALDGGVVYVGGSFGSIGGQSRSSLAALDRATGLATAWNPAVTGPVLALNAGDGAVFAGTGNTPAVLQFNETTSVAAGWQPAPNGAVRAIHRANGTIWLAGSFKTIAGEARPSFAAFADPAFVPTLGIPWSAHETGLRLAQNRPNPFRSVTRIRFSLPAAAQVRLRLLDPAGRLVQSVLDGVTLAAGEHDVEIESGRLRPGVYWYQLEAGTSTLTRRMVAIP